MEPDDASEYSKREYWDRRYQAEPTYDWFQSVYGETVSKILELLWSKFVGVASKQDDLDESTPPKQATVSVLHLGCGNSRLCHDLAAAWYARCAERNVTKCDLLQTAMDYSAVVIENMSKGEQPAVGPPVKWIVADMRDLSPIVPKQDEEQQQQKAPAANKCGDDDDEATAEKKAPNDTASAAASATPLFDVVIDKGTMDALQANKESDTLDEDIDAMMHEVSRVLRPNGVGMLIQVSWEATPFRKHWCLRDEYGWENDKFAVIKLNPDVGGDCLYRIFVYIKK